MEKYILPSDFTPDYKKAYENGDHPFAVWVEYKGLVTPKNCAPVHQWIYTIVVELVVVEAGVFYWDPSDRILSIEEVANNLATFYEESEQVKTGKPYYENDETALTNLIEKCRAHMFKEFYPDSVREIIQDFDIHIAVMNQNNWEIMLSMAVRPNMMYQFESSKIDTNKIKISSWVRSHVHSVDYKQF